MLKLVDFTPCIIASALFWTKWSFWTLLGQDSQTQNSASLVSPSVDKGSENTHTCTQTADMNGVCGCWLSCESVCVGGKRMDGWRRLMSAGTSRIVRHLMNECKLATVELIPPPRQDWKFSPLNDLLCESSSRSRQCNRFTIYCFSHSIPKCTIAHITSETALQVCISPRRATPSF